VLVVKQSITALLIDKKKNYKNHKNFCKNMKSETALTGNKRIVCMEAISKHFMGNPNFKNSAITKSGIRYWRASIKDWNSNSMVLISTTKEKMDYYFPFNPIADNQRFCNRNLVLGRTG